MTSPATYDMSAPAPEEQGYHKGLNNRQVQMIGIGGAIGTGLFMGAGGRLHGAGPGLFMVYAVCGVFVFFILRALASIHRCIGWSQGVGMRKVPFELGRLVFSTH
ncbi:L-asparagine permease AnsP1 [Mycobacteroides abscessus subsp. massiliense]|nr:L-asparagine permease AnsP1 [Mycobacteroides abscessus subsp. massiliense]